MKLTGLLLLLLAGVPAFCQKNTPEEDVHATLLVGKKKSLIAYAGPAHSFTMETTSKTAKPSDIPGFITFAGQGLQSTLVPAALSADPRHPPTAREKEFWVNNLNIDLAYFKRRLKQNSTGLQPK